MGRERNSLGLVSLEREIKSGVDYVNADLGLVDSPGAQVL